MSRTQEIESVAVLSNSSELIVQTLAEIIPSEFAVHTVRFSSVNWEEPDSLPQVLQESHCLLIDLTLDFSEFEKSLALLKNANPECKLIVLNDFRSAAFALKASEVEGVDSYLDMMDFPEQIEDELKSRGNSFNRWVGKFSSRAKSNF